MRARPRVRQRHFRQNLDRRIIQNFLTLHNAAMPVIGVFAEANVGNYKQFRPCFTNCLDSPLHHARSDIAFASLFIFVLRQPKKDHRRNAQVRDFAYFLKELIDGLLCNTRHRAHINAHALPGTHEHWVNQSCGRRPGLANEIPNRFAAPQTSRPVSRKTHACFTPPREDRLDELAKYLPIASINDFALGSAASIAHRTPAARIADAVVGPIAASAEAEANRSRSPGPTDFAKFSNADGLAKTKQSTPSRRIRSSCGPASDSGMHVRYARTATTSAPSARKASIQSVAPRLRRPKSLRGTSTFNPAAP